MPAPESILKLVETFEQNLSEYQSRKNKTELRREFLDKFFTALGWDVDNLQYAFDRSANKQHQKEKTWLATSVNAVLSLIFLNSGIPCPSRTGLTKLDSA